MSIPRDEERVHQDFLGATSRISELWNMIWAQLRKKLAEGPSLKQQSQADLSLRGSMAGHKLNKAAKPYAQAAARILDQDLGDILRKANPTQGPQPDAQPKKPARP